MAPVARAGQAQARSQEPPICVSHVGGRTPAAWLSPAASLGASAGSWAWDRASIPSCSDGMTSSRPFAILPSSPCPSPRAVLACLSVFRIVVSLGLLLFLIPFRISASLSTRDVANTPIGTVVNEECAVLLCCPPIYKHRMSLHLLKALVSFLRFLNFRF